MIAKYYYTDKEINELCKSIVVLVDTREKNNDHIINWLDKKHIKWKARALKNGDYSFMIPANTKLNIDRDLYFDKEIMVERKRSLDEVGANLTTYRARFEEEMATYKGKKYLLLENSTYEGIIEENYRNKLSAKAFLASIHTFNHRYNLEVVYMPNEQYSAQWIYLTFIYYIKNILR